ncbi:TPA: hypothetical protein QDB06_000742 [Burkholderia vietnamiensis]|nr:hypothetical protein [Burkholderia vietnamiensis]
MAFIKYKSDSEIKFDPGQDLTDRVLARMKEVKEAGIGYVKKWFTSDKRPVNALTNKPYSFLNAASLATYGDTDHRYIPQGEAQLLYEQTSPYYDPEKETKSKKAKSTAKFRKSASEESETEHVPTDYDKRFKSLNGNSDGEKNLEDSENSQVGSLYKKLGGHIKLRKGEKARKILFFKIKEYDGTEIDPETGDYEKKKSFILVYHNVYNINQFEGPIDKLFPALAERQMTAVEKKAEFTVVAQAMEADGVKFRHVERDRACYMPATDTIEMPPAEAFIAAGNTIEDYYRTLYHEFGHATGAKHRLNRDQTGAFGSKPYAFEELVAELASYFIGIEIGIPYSPSTHDNHMAYLNSWIEALENDKTFFMKAVKLATGAVEYELNRAQEFKSQQGIQTDHQAEVKREVQKVLADASTGPNPLEPKKKEKKQAEMFM